MNYIYLIGTTGAARTQSEPIASAFEQASGYRRCTQQEYIQRMREIRAFDLPPEPTETDRTVEDYNDQPNTCPTYGTPMDWERCDACGGKGHFDVYELDPLWYNPGDAETCTQCAGDGGWYTCPNYHNHPTEIRRTASDPAGTTPAISPATPLAGRQQCRQRKEPL